MKQFSLVPEIHKIATFDEFYQEFQINEKDLILTIEPIFNTYLKERAEKFTVVFPEQYALGEPTDEMIDQIVADIKDVDFNRVIAIGGGSIVDISVPFVSTLPCSKAFLIKL